MPRHAENTRNILDAFTYRRPSDKSWHGDQLVRELFVNENTVLTVRAPKNQNDNYTMQLRVIIRNMPFPGANQVLQLAGDDCELPHSSRMTIEEACGRAVAAAERCCKTCAKVMSESQTDLMRLAVHE